MAASITLAELERTLASMPKPLAPLGYRCNRATFEELKSQCKEIRDAGDRPPRFTGCTIVIDDWLPDGAFVPIRPEWRPERSQRFRPYSSPKPPETTR